MQIHGIPAFRDNYIWALHDGRRAAVVDPGDAAPVERFLTERGLELCAILATHHHVDHVGGIADLVARAGAGTLFVAGHSLDRERIRGRLIGLQDHDCI